MVGISSRSRSRAGYGVGLQVLFLVAFFLATSYLVSMAAEAANPDTGRYNFSRFMQGIELEEVTATSCFRVGSSGGTPTVGGCHLVDNRFEVDTNIDAKVDANWTTQFVGGIGHPGGNRAPAGFFAPWVHRRMSGTNWAVWSTMTTIGPFNNISEPMNSTRDGGFGDQDIGSTGSRDISFNRTAFGNAGGIGRSSTRGYSSDESEFGRAADPLGSNAERNNRLPGCAFGVFEATTEPKNNYTGCHGIYNAYAQGNGPGYDNRTDNLSCVGQCHQGLSVQSTNLKHGVVPNATCDACHKAQINITNSSEFELKSGEPVVIWCTDCHNKTSNFNATDGAIGRVDFAGFLNPMPFAHAGKDCRYCHGHGMNITRVGNATNRGWGSTCGTNDDVCHGSGAEPPRNISAAIVHGGAVINVTCGNCHVAPGEPAHNVTIPRCSKCHNSTGYTGTGSTNTTVDNSSASGPVPGWDSSNAIYHGNSSRGGYGGKSCGECHVPRDPSNLSKGFDASAHPHRINTTQLSSRNFVPSCQSTACHGNSTTPPTNPAAGVNGTWIPEIHAKTAAGSFKVRGGVGLECIDCHNNRSVASPSLPGGSFGVFGNVELNTSIHTSWPSRMVPFNIERWSNGSLYDRWPNGTIRDDQWACVNCHNKTVYYRSRNFSNPPLDCKGCHAQADGRLLIHDADMEVPSGEVDIDGRHRPGNPYCLRCHGTGGIAPFHVDNESNAMDSSDYAHLQLNNRSEGRFSDPGAVEDAGQFYRWTARKCWACHGNGSVPNSTNTLGDLAMGVNQITPLRCPTCHEEGSQFAKYKRIYGFIVDAHWPNGTDIRSGTQFSPEVRACNFCHNKSEMLLPANDPDIAGADFDRSLGYTDAGNISFFHYGRRRNDLKIVRNASTKNLFNYTNATRYNATNCLYCHQNSTGAFNDTMSTPEHYNIFNHTNKSAELFCVDCHGYGAIHNRNLTIPYRAPYSYDTHPRKVNPSDNYTASLGTVRDFENITELGDFGDSANFTEALLPGGYAENQSYVSSFSNVTGSLFNFSGMNSSSTGDYANLTEGAVLGQTFNPIQNGSFPDANSINSWNNTINWGQLCSAACSADWNSTYYNTSVGSLRHAITSNGNNQEGSVQSNQSFNIGAVPASASLKLAYKWITNALAVGASVKVKFTNASGTFDIWGNTTGLTEDIAWNSPTNSNLTDLTPYMQAAGSYSLRMDVNAPTNSMNAGDFIYVFWDDVDLTYTLPAAYSMNITTDITAPAGYENYTLQVLANRTGSEGFNIIVFNASSGNYTTRGQINSSTMSQYNITLSNADEVFNNTVRVRFVDNETSDAAFDEALIDYLRVNYSSTKTYSLNVTMNVTGVVNGSSFDVRLLYYTTSEPFRLYALNGSDGTYVLKGTLNETSYTNAQFPLSRDEYNNGNLFFRFLDGDNTSLSASNLFIDHLHVITNSPDLERGGMQNASLCQECHVSTRYQVHGLNSVNNSNTVNLTCASCHANPNAASADKQIHGIRYFNVSGNYSLPFSNDTAASCATCHQNASGGNFVPTINGSPSPRIPRPLNHSNVTNAGGRWDSYWNDTDLSSGNDSCYYCHGSIALHNSSALGRVASAGDPSWVNSTNPWSTRWCAACHYNDSSSNYTAMIGSLDPDPPEITNGSWRGVSGYQNHSGDYVVNNNYTDARCFDCHLSDSQWDASRGITRLTHNIMEAAAAPQVTAPLVIRNETINATSLNLNGDILLNATVSTSQGSITTVKFEISWPNGTLFNVSAIKQSGVDYWINNTIANDVRGRWNWTRTYATGSSNRANNTVPNASSGLSWSVYDTTTLTVALNDTVLVRGTENLLISAVLRNSTSNGISGETLTFFNGTTQLGTNVTNSTGGATLVWNVPSTQALGSILLNVTFAQNDSSYYRYSDGSQSAQVWANASVNESSANASSVAQGGVLVLQARLRLDNGSLVVGENVSWYSNESAGGISIGSNFTNSSGVAVLYWDTTGRAVASHRINASHPANSTSFTLASENSSLVIQITSPPDTTPPVISGERINATNMTRGESILLNATVTDNAAVSSVRFEISWPNGTLFNVSASLVSGYWINDTIANDIRGRWNWTRTYANDTSGNTNITVPNASSGLAWSVYDTTSLAVSLNDTVLVRGVESLLVSAVLTNSTSNGIAGETLTFFNGTTQLGTNVTNSTGGATLVWAIPSSQALGSILLNVTFAQNDSSYYRYSDSSQTAQVWANTSVNESASNASSVPQGGVLVLQARLRLDNGSLVIGENITWTYDGVNFIGSNFTNTSGVASFAWGTSGVSVGSHTINASHPANSTSFTRASENTSLVVTVTDSTPPLISGERINATNMTLNEDILLNATVTDAESAVSSVRFEISWPNGTLFNVSASNVAGYWINDTIANDLRGRWNWSRTYATSTGGTNVTVPNASSGLAWSVYDTTTLTVGLNDTVLVRGSDSLLISAVLRNSSSNGVAGETLTFFNGTTQLGTNVTNSTGGATLVWNVPTSQALGSILLNVTFAQNDTSYYRYSDASQTAQVWANTSVNESSANASSVAQGGMLVLQAKLRFDNGSLVVGENVSWYSNESAGGISIGSNFTNSSGVAVLYWDTTGRAVASHRINASHPANSTSFTRASENTSLVISITDASPPFISGERINATNMTLNEGILLNATVTDAESSVSSVRFEIRWPNGTLFNVSASNVAGYWINDTIANDLRGRWNWTRTYATSSGGTNITVPNASNGLAWRVYDTTTLSIGLNDSVLIRGVESLLISAVLLNSTSNGIAGETLTFFNGTTQLGTNVTNSTGGATLVWSVPSAQALGSILLNVTFAQNDSSYYRYSDGAQSAQVWANTSVNESSSNSTSVPQGGIVVLQAKLRLDNGSLVVGENITWTYDGVNPIGSNFTNSSGVASFAWSTAGVSVAAHTINASHPANGSSFTRASENSSLVITVTDATPPLISGERINATNMTLFEDILLNATVTDAESTITSARFEVSWPNGTLFNVSAARQSGTDYWINDTIANDLRGRWNWSRTYATSSGGTNVTVPNASSGLSWSVYDTTTLTVGLNDSVLVRGAESLLISAVLRNSTSDGIAVETLTFYNGTTSLGTNVTNSTGGATFVWSVSAGQALGSILLNVTFAQNDSSYYRYSDGSQSAQVWANTSINESTSNSTTVPQGGIVVLQAKLRFDNGSLVVGENVTWTYDGVNPIGSNFTNSSGVASFAWSTAGVGIGAHTINASHPANSSSFTRASENTSLVITITDSTPPFISGERINATNMTLNEDVLLNATVTDAESSISSVRFEVSWPNGTLFNVSASSVAGYWVNDTIANDVRGRWNWTRTYATSSGGTNITVPNASNGLAWSVYDTTTLSVGLNDSVLIRGVESLLISAVLRNSTSNGIAGETLTFFNGTTQLGTNVTNSTGGATLVWSVPSAQTLGSILLNVTFAQNDSSYYRYSDGSQTAQVWSNTSVNESSANASSVPEGGIVMLQARLRLDNGSLVVGENITWYSNESGQIGSNFTNSSGVASFSWSTAGVGGSHRINASHPANSSSFTLASENTSVVVIVTDSTPPFISGERINATNMSLNEDILLNATVTDPESSISSVRFEIRWPNNSLFNVSASRQGATNFWINDSIANDFRGRWNWSRTYATSAGGTNITVPNASSGLAWSVYDTTTLTVGLNDSVLIRGVESLLISAVLRNSTSNGISGETLTFFNGTTQLGTNVTNSTGGATLVWNVPSTQALGSILLNVTFAQNDSSYYRYSDGSQSAQVWANASVNESSANASSVAQGGVLVLQARLRLDNGSLVVGENVSWYSNESGGISIGSNFTNSSGVASFAWNTAGRAVASHRINASHPANGTSFTLASENSSLVITVTDSTPPLISGERINATNMSLNEDILLNATVTDAESTVSSVRFEISWPNGTLFNVSASNVAGYWINDTIANDLRGRWNWTRTYATSSGGTNITVPNASYGLVWSVYDTTTLTVGLNDSVLIRGVESLLISAVLRNSTSNGIAGEALTFFNGTTQLGTNVTNSTGGATLVWSVPSAQVLGSILLNVTFAQNDSSYYRYSDGSQTAQVWANTSVNESSSNASSVAQGGILVLQAKLRLDNGSLVVGANVTWTYDGVNPIGSNFTNSSGVASFSWSTAGVGIGAHTINASHPANSSSFTRASENSSLVITVTDSTPPLISGERINATNMTLNEDILLNATVTDAESAVTSVRFEVSWPNGTLFNVSASSVAGYWINDTIANDFRGRWNWTRTYATSTGGTNITVPNSSSGLVWSVYDTTTLTVGLNDTVLVRGAESLLISAVLRNSSSNGVAGETLTFFNGTTQLGTNVTNSTGGATLVWNVTSQQALGSILLNVTFAQNDTSYYRYSDASQSAQVWANTSVNESSSNSTTVPQGGIVVLQAKLRLDNGSLVVGENITWYSNSSGQIGSNFTNSSGVASFAWNTAGVALGSHRINASHPANSTSFTRASENTSLVVAIIDATPPLISGESINATSLNLNEDILLNATVSDAESAVSSVLFEIRWPNNSLFNVSASLVSGYWINDAIANDLRGRWNWTRTYATSSGGTNITVPNSSSGLVWSAYDTTTLSVSLNDSVLVRGEENLLISAVLTNSTSNGLAGETLTFYNGTTQLGTKVTNSTGDATFVWSVPSTQRLGSILLNVTYTQNDTTFYPIQNGSFPSSILGWNSSGWDPSCTATCVADWNSTNGNTSLGSLRHSMTSSANNREGSLQSNQSFSIGAAPRSASLKFAYRWSVRGLDAASDLAVRMRFTNASGTFTVWSNTSGATTENIGWNSISIDLAPYMQAAGSYILRMDSNTSAATLDNTDYAYVFWDDMEISYTLPSYYRYSDGSATAQVWANTSVNESTSNATSVSQGGVVVLQAKLRLDNGSVVVGENVSWYSNETSPSWLFIGSNFTNSSGIAVLYWDTTGRLVAMHRINASHPDNSTSFTRASENSSLLVQVTTPADTTPPLISGERINATNMTLNEDILLNATATDAESTVTAVRFEIRWPNGTLFNVSASRQSGTDYWINDTIANDLRGRWNWTRTYATSTGGTNITVPNASSGLVWSVYDTTTLTVGLNDTVLVRGAESLLISAVLRNSSSNGVAGETLTFYNGTTQLGTNVTNSTGGATLVWDVPSAQVLGSILLNVTFAQNDSSYYRYSDASQSAQVWANTSVNESSSNSTSVPQGGILVLQAKLRLDNGSLVAGENITWTYDGVNPIGSNFTNSSGVAGFSWSTAGVGIGAHTINASHPANGSSFTRASENSSLVITVTDATPPVISGERINATNMTLFEDILLNATVTDAESTISAVRFEVSWPNGTLFNVSASSVAGYWINDTVANDLRGRWNWTRTYATSSGGTNITVPNASNGLVWAVYDTTTLTVGLNDSVLVRSSESLLVSAVLRNSTSDGVAGETLAFYNGTTQLGTNVTNSTGGATLVWDVTSQQALGSILLNVTHAQNDSSYYRYSDGSQTAQIWANTSVNESSSNASSVAQGGVLVLQAKLTLDNGSLVVGENVTWTYDGVNPIGSNFTNSSGVASFVWSTAGVSVAAHTINASHPANSSSFTRASENTSLVITITSPDSTPPSVSLVSPPDNNLTNVSTVRFNATVTDNVNATNASLWHNATGTWHLNQSNTTCRQANSTTIECGFSIVAPDVGFVWNVQGFDNRSNSAYASANRSVTVDTLAPSVSIAYPVNGSSYNNSNFTYFVNGTSSDLRLDSARTNHSSWAGVDSSPAEFNLSNTSALSDGWQSLRVSVNDTAGNTGYAVVTFFFNHTTVPPPPPDSTPPIITVQSPVNNTRFNISSVWINVTLDEPGSAVIAERDGVENNSLTNSSGNWNYLWTGLANGFRDFRIYANDTAGNMNASVRLRIRIDTNVPNISFNPNTPANNTITANASFVVNVTVEEDDAVDTVLFFVNDTAYAMTQQNVSAGVYYYNRTHALASDGDYRYYVFVNDSAGNSNRTGIRIITKDSAPPVITIISPANASTNDTTPLLNATFAGESVNATWYSVDSGTNSTPARGVANLTVELSTLADGVHNVSVYANDSAGNLNSSTRFFTVDTIFTNISFIDPTPANSSIITVNYATINVSVNDSLSDADSAILEWNLTTNYTMTRVGSGRVVTFYYNVTSLSNGNYSYRVFANDSAGNLNVSATRTLTVNFTSPAYLEVVLVYPNTENRNVVQNDTFWVNATVTCREGSCGAVNGTVRYTTAGEPDKEVNATVGAVPFYVIGDVIAACKGGAVMASGESCQLNWTVNATGAFGLYITDVNFTSSTGLANNTANAEKNITARTQYTIMNLRASFNVQGWPFADTPIKEALQNLSGKHDVVWFRNGTYANGSSQWLFYDAVLEFSPNGLDLLRPGRMYEINLTVPQEDWYLRGATQSANLTFRAPAAGTSSCFRGLCWWETFSWPFQSTNIYTALSSLGSNQWQYITYWNAAEGRWLYAYTQSYSSFNEFNTLEPARGYWIWMWNESSTYPANGAVLQLKPP